MRILPMGQTAVLVDEIDGEPAAWANGVRASGIAGIVDVVPAARTVLVVCDSPAHLTSLRERIGGIIARPIGTDAPAVELVVRYDGPDLAYVAAAAKMTIDEVVARHSGGTYTVAFCGFAPGFGYLSGLDERLHLPRRATPRTSVAAGSVAIAAQYTAVYPARSPGGWHILGTTDAVMFDVSRESPSLLQPGASVRFRPA